MADIYFEPCDYGNVCSCIMQFCKEEEERIKPCYGIYVISVWFPDAAKEFLDINISDDQLTIMQKEIYQYKMLYRCFSHLREISSSPTKQAGLL